MRSGSLFSRPGIRRLSILVRGTWPAAEASHERVQRQLVVDVDCGHPPFEIPTAPLAHDLGERADVPGQRGRSRTECQDRLQARPVSGSEGCWGWS